jgi:hypothetical protein
MLGAPHERGIGSTNTIEKDQGHALSKKRKLSDTMTRPRGVAVGEPSDGSAETLVAAIGYPPTIC